VPVPGVAALSPFVARFADTRLLLALPRNGFEFDADISFGHSLPDAVMDQEGLEAQDKAVRPRDFDTTAALVLLQAGPWGCATTVGPRAQPRRLARARRGAATVVPGRAPGGALRGGDAAAVRADHRARCRSRTSAKRERGVDALRFAAAARADRRGACRAAARDRARRRRRVTARSQAGASATGASTASVRRYWRSKAASWLSRSE